MRSKVCVRFALVLFFLSFSRLAPAAIPASLYAPANCVAHNTAPLNYVICDDGVPAAGGSSANSGGALAVTVPAEYGGDGYTGLPDKKTPTSVGGADSDGNIALDVDISLPLTPPPAEGYPLLFFMHGCCGGTKTSWQDTAFSPSGEHWHYNNAWFASRGYVVVTYTARGFASGGPAGPNRAGSTGETQVDSRKFEINDYQHLACQVLANASHWNAVSGQAVKINPLKVIATGGSYGGGFAWMALTDPVWTCTADTGAPGAQMKLAAVAPRYGWTDLLDSLVPTGRHSSDPALLPSFDGCASGPKHPDGTDCATPVPVGIPKQSINAGLYATGLMGANFPQEIHQAQACLSGAYPSESNPACSATLATTLPAFLADRSAYYQQAFFDKIALDPSYRIPVFNAGTLTDALFPPVENRQMVNRLLAATGGAYPIQSYYGDYQHFTQNKNKEWGDICGVDHHVCSDADYAGGNFNVDPTGLVRQGVHSRLNRFLDFYIKPTANPSQTAPSFDVTASTTICKALGSASQPGDEPGPTFVADRFENLSDGTLMLDSGGSAPALTVGSTGAMTTSSVGASTHSDPVINSGNCLVRKSTDPAPAGIAFYETQPLAADVQLVGATRVAVKFTASGDSASVQLNARLYDVQTSGDAYLVDRAVGRLSSSEVAGKAIRLETFSNLWRFPKGDKIRIELMQDDSPYLKASLPPSSLSLTQVTLSIPTRSASSSSSSGSSSGSSSSGSSSGSSSSGSSSGSSSSGSSSGSSSSGSSSSGSSSSGSSSSGSSGSSSGGGGAFSVWSLLGLAALRRRRSMR